MMAEEVDKLDKKRDYLMKMILWSIDDSIMRYQNIINGIDR